MISEKKALQILKEEGCSPEVIDHVKAVTDKSVEIAERIRDNGHDVDVDLVRIGSLLHDVGRSKTHDISHGIEGARILRERGLEEFAPFAENHIGAGITLEEAESQGLPPKDYTPSSLEEEIVTYGDNLIRGDEVISFEEAMDEFREDLGPDHPSLKRFQELHDKIEELSQVSKT